MNYTHTDLTAARLNARKHGFQNYFVSDELAALFLNFYYESGYKYEDLQYQFWQRTLEC